jgi:hypothetical protein
MFKYGRKRKHKRKIKPNNFIKKVIKLMIVLIVIMVLNHANSVLLIARIGFLEPGTINVCCNNRRCKAQTNRKSVNYSYRMDRSSGNWRYKCCNVNWTTWSKSTMVNAKRYERSKIWSASISFINNDVSIFLHHNHW